MHLMFKMLQHKRSMTTPESKSYLSITYYIDVLEDSVRRILFQSHPGHNAATKKHLPDACYNGFDRLENRPVQTNVSV